MRHVVSMLVALAALLAGCAVAPGAFGSSDSDLLEVDPATVPLEPIAVDAWRSAPAGCEGKLVGAQFLTFRVASDVDGLIAALDVTGEVLCVDTVESVEEELVACGHHELASTLRERYAAFRATEMRKDFEAARAGDPTPQPNVDPACSISITSGDPTPQPNRERG